MGATVGDHRHSVRLNRLYDQVRRGRYRVAAEQVADAILASGGRGPQAVMVRPTSR